MHAPVLEQSSQEFLMDGIAGRLSAYIRSAEFSMEVDNQDQSLYIRQLSPSGSAKAALKELFEALRAEGVSADEVFIEFVPYNGPTQIVMGDETGVSLTPRDSAIGQALWKTAYQKVARHIDESMFAPPPAEVVSMPLQNREK